MADPRLFLKTLLKTMFFCDCGSFWIERRLDKGKLFANGSGEKGWRGMCGYDDSLTMSCTAIGTALELDPLERVGGVCRNWNKGRTEKNERKWRNGTIKRVFGEWASRWTIDGRDRIRATELLILEMLFGKLCLRSNKNVFFVDSIEKERIILLLMHFLWFANCINDRQISLKIDY